MHVKVMLCLIIVLLCSTITLAEDIILNSSIGTTRIFVEESDIYRTVVRFDIGSYSKEPVEINGETYYSLNLGRENILLNEGEPALPRICRSIIIPDYGEARVRIMASEYIDYPDMPVTPSKGNIYRGENSSDIPYKFSSVYSSSDWYPGHVALVREPYIIRDYRGTVIEAYPFQYNPQSRTLRVYTSITVEVTVEDKSSGRALGNSEFTLDPAFDKIYDDRFINYPAAQAMYAAVVESGDMLIITHDDFHGAMLPFAEWKRQKGIKTTIVDVSTIGNDVLSIQDFVQDFYDSTNLAWLILVGDAAEVVTPTASGGSSDPTYAKLAGSDDYPEIFVGRFSAQTQDQLQTQIDRTLVYEKNPPGSGWFARGSGVASNEGAGIGHNGGEIDYEHMSYIRDDLLGYTYAEVDEIYDPGALKLTLSNALNDGRSFVNYAGHGSTTYWVTTGFSNVDINNLTNDYMLPFVISVGCINGNFDGYTCFGESWLRATHDSAPTGAIATYMSSINQSWAPPMDAQDEIVDLLVSNSKTTIGGLCYNGSCKMMDLNGLDGVEMFDTWIIFGDPSVQLWHSDPAAWPMVGHEISIAFDTNEYVVDLLTVEGALCVLYADGVIYGRAYSGSDGRATIIIDQLLPLGQELTLTVTGDNRRPYITTLAIVSPDGPYVVYDQSQIDDPAGNGDGLVNNGESILLDMQLKNIGPDIAYDVSAVLSTDDTLVTITDGDEYYGQINGGAAVNLAGAFSFDVSSAMPDGREIVFTISATDAGDSVWTSELVVPVQAPLIGCLGVYVDDTSGNSNSVFDPYESVDLSVTLENTGLGSAQDITAVLSCSSPYITIDKSEGSFGELTARGGTADNLADNFIATADIICPRGEIVAFELEISGAAGYLTTIEFELTISDRETFFTDDFSTDLGWSGLGGSGEWTIGPAAGGIGSDSYGNADPSFDHSPTEDNRVLGNDLTGGMGGDYNSDLNKTYWAVSPVLDCSAYDRVTLGFYRWLGVEGSYDYALLEVYDGSQWVRLFENGDSTYADASWHYEEYDLSSTANGNAAFQIRFGIGETDGSWNYCGWNIDDLTLKAYNISPLFTCGDVNMDETINVGDAVYLVNYVFKYGPAPEPLIAGDANGDGTINVGDAVQLITHIFKDGNPPHCVD